MDIVQKFRNGPYWLLGYTDCAKNEVLSYSLMLNVNLPNWSRFVWSTADVQTIDQLQLLLNIQARMFRRNEYDAKSSITRAIRLLAVDRFRGR